MPDIYFNGVKDYKMIVRAQSYQQSTVRGIFPYALHFANNSKKKMLKPRNKKLVSSIGVIHLFVHGLRQAQKKQLQELK